MLILNYVFLTILGLASGAVVASGYVAVITMLGVIPRYAGITKTAKHMMLYENCVILGVVLGNAVDLFEFAIPLGYPILFLQGLFSGVFVGALAVALGEILKVIPIFARRYKLRKGMPYLVLAFAFGKMTGSFVQYYLLN